MTDEMRDLTIEEIESLKIAGELIDVGVPVFAAAPNPDRPGQYFLPRAWQQTPAYDRRALEQWRPGWALAAVGGHAADFIDFDPRNGGTESEKELRLQGQMPRAYGVQSTPSGGTHLIITPTGERKATGFMPGVDLQAGSALPDEHGSHGRGFVYIAPTVRPSKAPETLGQLRPYVWARVPDMGYLQEFRGADDSLDGLLARVHAARGVAGASAGVTGASLGASVPASGVSQLFLQPSRARDLEHRFTLEQAIAFVQPALSELERAQDGEINNRLLAAALTMAHFGPEFWPRALAEEHLMKALRCTVWDDATWKAADTIRRAYADMAAKQGADYWAAELVTPQLGQQPETGRLKRALLTRSQMHELADPVPLIEDVLYRESVVVLSGKFGTYKSFVAVSWAASLATGEEWFGHRVPARVPVIYAAAEGAYGIRRRFDAWERKHGVTIPDDLYLISVSVRINRPGDVTELEEIIRETGAQVLIFDTLHMSTPGVDENDSGEMGMVMDVLRVLQQRYGITSILPHHTGHAGERARGSSSVEDDADTSFVIRIEGEDRGPETARTLIHRKTKDAALLEPVTLKLELIPGSSSGVVRAYNAFEDAEEQAVADASGWHPPVISVTRMIGQVLAENGHDRGLTKPEVRSIVVERWYGGESKRLKANTWHGDWNRALKGDEIVNVGGERFSADPLVIESLTGETGENGT